MGPYQIGVCLNDWNFLDSHTYTYSTDGTSYTTDGDIYNFPVPQSYSDTEFNPSAEREKFAFLYSGTNGWKFFRGASKLVPTFFRGFRIFYRRY